MHNKFIKYFSTKYSNLPILDRWILGQLIPPLFFSIAAFTVVSLSVGILFDLIRKMVEYGLPMAIALKIMILKLPGFLVISFPMSVLLSTLLAYGKLSSNSELLALKSLGINKYRILAPALALSIFMTGLTFYFNNSLVPKTNKSAEALMRNGLDTSVVIERGYDIFFPGYTAFTDPNTNLSTKRNTYLTQIFFSRVVENNVMKNVTVLDFSKTGYKQILSAKQGIFEKSISAWIFIDGRLITLDNKGNTTSIGFDKYTYPLGDGPLKISKIPKDANEMTVKQAIEAKNLYLQSGNIREARKMSVRIQEKFTFPFACVVFALIGSSLGSKSNLRSSRSQGFGLSVILILVYYVFSFVSSAFGVKGIFPPFLSAWLPVISSLLGGMYLLKRST